MNKTELEGNWNEQKGKLKLGKTKEELHEIIAAL
jgi:hypothetical protein